MTQKVIVTICDYPRGDLADLEVRLALREYLEGWSLDSASAPSFKTLATGFAIAQVAGSPLARRLSPHNFLIYANCAPRKDQEEKRHDNEGEGLVFAETKHGVRILAVNSGYSLSVVREDIVRLQHVNVPNGGSQFRSRDNFPYAVGRVAIGDLKAVLGKELDPKEVVKDVPNGRVGYIDSFGNLKLTLRANDPEFLQFKEGDEVRVKIGSVPRVARVTNGSFSVNEGDLALAPGSSGYDNRFVELFLRGGSAQAHFDNKAAVESRVEFEKIKSAKVLLNAA